MLLGDGAAITRARGEGIVMTGERRTLTARQVADLYRRPGAAGLFRSRQYRTDVLDGPAARTATTRWFSGGRLRNVVVRPLLPYERDCAAISGR